MKINSIKWGIIPSIIKHNYICVGNLFEVYQFQSSESRENFTLVLPGNCIEISHRCVRDEFHEMKLSGYIVASRARRS